MKKRCIFLFLVFGVNISLMADITHVLINGVYYNLNVGLKTASVTYYDISKYKSNSNFYKGDIVIPSEVEYKNLKFKVTDINDNALKDCEEVTSVSLPTSLKRIGKHAFEDCYSLASVNFYDGIEEIADYAFRNCVLTSISLPGSLRTVGACSFENCRLTSLTIPEGVTRLGTKAFYNNRNLLTISIPSTLTQLGHRCFEGTSWFDQEEMRNYETGRLYLNGWLCGIFNDGDVGDIEIKEGCIGIADGIFDQQLESVKLPSTLLYIGEAAFRYSNIQSIDIPNSVTTIHAGAFNSCKNLTSVHIGNGVYKIGKDAFRDTPWLENQPNGLVYAGNVACVYKYNYWEEPLDDVVLKDGCTGIADGFFNSAINSISIPATVKYIGETGWFVNRMSSIVVEKGNAIYDSRHNCNAIVETATNTLVLGCKKTIIPEGITTLGRLSMANTELSSVTIPNSVEEIADRVFEGTALESIRIPGSVVYIGREVFGANNEIKSIIVDGDNTIYDSRENCNAIIETFSNTLIAGCKASFIPQTIETIESFSCEEMSDLYCYADKVPTAAFIYPYQTILHVPENSVEAYMAVAPWNNFKKIVAIGSESGISITTVDPCNRETWYDINGIRLIGQPQKGGVYLIRTVRGHTKKIAM